MKGVFIQFFINFLSPKKSNLRPIKTKKRAKSQFTEVYRSFLLRKIIANQLIYRDSKNYDIINQESSIKPTLDPIKTQNYLGQFAK